MACDIAVSFLTLLNSTTRSLLIVTVENKLHRILKIRYFYYMLTMPQIFLEYSLKAILNYQSLSIISP